MSTKAKAKPPAAPKAKASAPSSSSASTTKKAAASSSTVKKSGSGSGKKESGKSGFSHLFEKSSRSYGIGRALPPKKNISRFVLWPTYIRLQRQRAILKKRLKVPPALNQFSRTLEKNQASQLFRLLAAYRPESHDDKKKRLFAAAKSEEKKEEKKESATGKPYFVKHGLNHITHLVETRKAKLVVIAHDVDPIELVVWLPALCRKLNVPYCIVKGKARLGHLVHQKTTSALAITDVRKEDASKLEQLVTAFRGQYNEDVTSRKKWGGGVMGIKHDHVMKRREKVRAREASKK